MPIEIFPKADFMAIIRIKILFGPTKFDKAVRTIEKELIIWYLKNKRIYNPKEG